MQDVATLSADELDELADAVVVWLGRHEFSWPHREDARVVARFGAERAAHLLPILRALQRDFYSTDARFTASNVPEMGAAAQALFRRKYPLLRSSVAEAFAWAYTFDCK